MAIMNYTTSISVDRIVKELGLSQPDKEEK